MTANVKHFSNSEEHLTPGFIVSASRRTLRRFDLDPASTEESNELIKADRIFTRTDDGLNQPWKGRIFLNPPGGSMHKARTIEDPGKWGYTKSRQALWWLKLMIEFSKGPDSGVDAAIFVGFSIEILQVAQHLKCDIPTNFPMCVPSTRIPFDMWKGGRRVSQPQPAHANVIVLVSDDLEDIDRFKTSYGSVGDVFNVTQAVRKISG